MKVYERLVFYLISFFLLFFGLNSIWCASLYRSSSNTLVFVENFNDNVYLNTGEVNGYLTSWGGGIAGPAGVNTWAWDGPTYAIAIDKSRGYVYVGGEWGVESQMLTSSPPFTTTSGRFRFDVWIHKLDTSGNPVWTQTTRARTTNISYVYFDDGASRNPQMVVDETSGALFLTYNERMNDGTWRVMLQRVNPDGTKPWPTEVIVTNQYSSYRAGLSIYSNWVFVAFVVSGQVFVSKYDKNTGTRIAGPVRVDTTGSCLYPQIDVSPDGTLYVAWIYNGATPYNIKARALDYNLNLVSWGGDTNEKTINVYSGYGFTSYWYGWTEAQLDIAIDKVTTNLYVVWSLEKGGKQQIFGQKVNVYNRSFVRMWTSGGVDPNMSVEPAGNEAYPSISAHNDIVFVCWVTHRSDLNDRILVQRINPSTGEPMWSSDVAVEPRHHGDIDIYGTRAYITGVDGSVSIVDIFGNILRNYSYRDRTWVTTYYFGTKKVLPGTVLEAKIFETSVYKPSGSSIQYWVSGDGGNTNYQLTDINSTVTLTTTSNYFKYYVVADAYASAGKNRVYFDTLTIEAVRSYFGDILVGLIPDGSDAIGELLDEPSAQSKSVYVYNNGINSAVGYFFIKNNGNVSTNFRLLTTAGDPNWNVQYYISDTNGTEIQNITSSITSTGFITNLDPFNTSSPNWLIIKVKVTPSTSLSAGAQKTFSINVDGQLGASSWAPHDQASLTVIVSSARPDLWISKATGPYIGNDIVNSDGLGQTQKDIADTNISRTFWIVLENEGGSENIQVYATPGDNYWDVKYYTNGIDVTASITNTGISVFLNSLAKFSNFSVVITPLPGVAVNSYKNFSIRAQSSSDPTKEDVVLISITNTETKIDLIINSIGYGVYTNDPSVQLISSSNDNGFTNTYVVTVSNAGSFPMPITIIASQSNTLSPNWYVKYYHILGSSTNDITSQITNTGGYNVGSIITGGTTRLLVEIATPQNHNDGANETMGVYLKGIGYGDPYNSLKQDTVGINYKCISSKVDLAVDGNGLNIIETIPTTQVYFKYAFTNTSFTITLSNSADSSYAVISSVVTQGTATGFLISVSNNGNDISSNIFGNYYTNFLNAGATTNFVVTYRIDKNTAIIGSTNELIFQTKSLINPNDIDTVKLSVEYAVPPDIQGRKTNELTYNGNNVYGGNPVDTAQISSSAYPQGGTTFQKFIIKVENDRPYAEGFLLKATNYTNAWLVLYYKYIGSTPENPNPDNSSDWLDITTQISSTGYTNTSLSPSSYEIFKIEVKPDTATNEGDKIDIDLVATGLTTGFKDVYRITVSYGIGIPDIVFNEGIEQSTDFDNIYTNDYAYASVTNYVNKSKGSSFRLIIQNDSPTIPGSFYVYSEGNKGPWRIRFFNQVGIDVSTSVTNTPGYTVFVPPQSSVTLSFVIDASNSTYSYGTITNFDITVSAEGLKEDVLRFYSIITDYGKPDIILGDNVDNLYHTNDIPVLGTNREIGYGDTITQMVVIQNDAEVDEVLKLFGSGDSGYWTVRYFIDTTEITGDITNAFTTPPNPYVGGYQKLIPSTSSCTLQVIITLSSNADYPIGYPKNFYIYVFSEGRLVREGSRIQVVVKDFGKPDIVASSVSGWDNLYEPNASIQVVDTNIQMDWENVYVVYLQNDRDKPETLRFLGAQSTKPWTTTYEYFDPTTTSWSNITSIATNTGAHLYIPAHSQLTLKVKTYLEKTNIINLGDTYRLDFYLISWMGFVTDAGAIRYTVADLSVPDIALTNGLWENIYEPLSITPTNIEIEKGETVTIPLYLENDSPILTNSFYWVGSTLPPDFSLRYEYFLTNLGIYTNVTWEVQNTNFLIKINPNEKHLAKISITLNPSSTLITNQSFPLKIGLISEYMENKDIGMFNIVVVDRGLPDIALTNGDWNDLREDKANIQKLTRYIGIGDTITQLLEIQNDRTDKTENIKIIGNYVSSTDFSLTYYIVTNSVFTDVTTLITNWNYSIDIGPTNKIGLMLVMSLSSNSVLLTNYRENIVVKAVSGGRCITDEIMITYEIRDLALPDIILTTDWDNIRENPPSIQITNIPLEYGHTQEIVFYLQNDRTDKPEELRFYAPPSTGSWNVGYYYYLSSWSNITALVTNTWTNILPPTSTITMKVVVSIPFEAGELLGSTYYLDMRLQSWMGYVYDKASIRFVLSDLATPNIMQTNLSWSNSIEPIPSSQQLPIEQEKGVTNETILILKNENNTYEKYRLYVLQNSTTTNMQDWYVSYYLYDPSSDNWTNITPYITNTGYELLLTNLEDRLLKVIMYVPYTSSLRLNDQFFVYLYFKSFKEQTVDSARLIYTIVDKSKPDIVFDGYWNDIYTYIGGISQQSTNIYMEKSQTKVIPLLLQNDSGNTYDFILKTETPIDTNNLAVSLYISNGPSLLDITTDFTNEGHLLTLSNYEERYAELHINILPNSSLNTNDIRELLFFLSSEALLYKEYVRILIGVEDKGNPDIQLTTGEWLGISDTQISNVRLTNGQSTSLSLRLHNARTDNSFPSENMLLKVTPTLLDYWDIKVFMGTEEITTSVTNDGTNINLANGSYTDITINVQLATDSDIPSATTNPITIELFSQGRVKKDLVKYNLIKVAPRPDLNIVSLSSTNNSTIGDNVYYPTNQEAYGYVIVKEPAVYSVSLENDDALDDKIHLDLILPDPSITNKWSISIIDQSVDMDVFNILLNGGNDYNIEGRSGVSFQVKVGIIGEIALQESNVIILRAYSLRDTNKIDEIKIITKRVPVLVIGKVVERKSGTPIKGASVSFIQKFGNNSTVTNITKEDGSFAIELIPGLYKFIVKKYGYVDYEVEMNIPETLVYDLGNINMLPVNLDLTKEDGHIFPNPGTVGSSYTILVNVPETSIVRIEIYDLQGKLVKKLIEEQKAEGVYTIRWDGRNENGGIVERGVYIILFQVNRKVFTKKLYVK